VPAQRVLRDADTVDVEAKLIDNWQNGKD